MSEICDCCCEKETSSEVTGRIVFFIFSIIGTVWVAVENNGNEGVKNFQIIAMILVIYFLVMYYFLFCILKCCECCKCGNKCERCLNVTLFIFNTIILLLEIIIIIFGIVNIAKTKKYEETDKIGNKSYKILDSKYKEFLGLSISGLILMLFGLIYILYDYIIIKREISKYDICNCNCDCCKTYNKKNNVYNNSEVELR